MTLENRILPEDKRKILNNLLGENRLIRFIEVHNGVSALIANSLNVEVGSGDEVVHREFDGFWESSFTDSASKGLPDVEIVSYDSRLQTIQQILNVTAKPMIVDGDTGGEPTNFEYFVKQLEMLGVSGVIIEDKKFPKRNSLSTDARHVLEEPELFTNKLQRGKAVITSDTFNIFARIESLIAGLGQNDAISRAEKYLKGGVDGIVIHSNKSTPDEILEFGGSYKKLCDEIGLVKPLICIPTTYNIITEQELERAGFNLVIYANHMLRASYQAMENVLRSILSHQRSLEADPLCAPVKTIFEKVGFFEIKSKDDEAIERQGLKAIIPAAGANEMFDVPKALLTIHGQPILKHQTEVLKKCGVNKIVLIRGFKKDAIDLMGITYYDNDDYMNGFVLDSLFKAGDEMNTRFLFVNSDILFDDFLIKNLIDTDMDIVIVIDRTYKYHKHLIEKELDLVIEKSLEFDQPRRIIPKFERRILRIGKKIQKELATAEFIGIAYFSAEGAKNLKKVYDDCQKNRSGRFHEAVDLKHASITDILQEMIDRGYKVHHFEVMDGWIEIHNKDDLKYAEKILAGSMGED
jgi:phosphoenolpyruvate phosphomutase